MGCNCGSERKKPQTWTHTAPDGVKTTYATLTEAQDAARRKGGTYKAS